MIKIGDVTDESRRKPYRVEISVAAGRDEVWDAVTQPPIIRQWFGWDYDGLDDEIKHIFVNEAKNLAPERMGWADGSYLEVSGDDKRSTVRAVRGEQPARDPERYDAIEEGWKAFLVQLRHLLDKSPKGLRRTIYLTGTAAGRKVLGLATGDWAEVGTRVAWAVDRAGHLIVVSAQLPLDSPGAGHIEVILSTFGATDAAFDAYRESWSRRWTRMAKDATVTVGMDS